LFSSLLALQIPVAEKAKPRRISIAHNEHPRQAISV
jgi:HSP20 family protein